VKQTDVNVPYRIGEYYYYSRTERGSSIRSTRGRRGNLEVGGRDHLISNELPRVSSFSPRSYRVSDDGNSWPTPPTAPAIASTRSFVKDLRTGALLPEKIERVDTVMWATDNKTSSTSLKTTSRSVRTVSTVTFSHVAYDLVFTSPTSFTTSAPSARATRPSSLSNRQQDHLGGALPPGEQARGDAARGGGAQDRSQVLPRSSRDRFYIRTNNHAKTTAS